MTIKDMRKGRGLSQEQAAELLGIKQSYYSRIERGEANPTVGKLIDLAEIYEQEADELVAEFIRSAKHWREEVVSLLYRCAAVTRRRSSVCAPGFAVA